MSDTDTAIGGFGDILRRAQAESDHATQRIREDTAARQTAALASLQARQAAWPENRAPAPAADADALREALRRAQEASWSAEVRLHAAIEAGRRGEDHCTVVRRQLGAIEEVERKHAGALASIIRAGTGYQPPPALTEARARRPGAEREAAAADAACAELAADIAKAQREVDGAAAAVSESAKAIMGREARQIADEIAVHEQAAGELYRSIVPLAETWFGSLQGKPGGPVPLDTLVRSVFAKPPRLSGSDNVPPAIRTARATAATDRWKAFFAALLVDAEAELETEAA
jgi:hypothetical protein